MDTAVLCAVIIAAGIYTEYISVKKKSKNK